jgi:4-methylaminobutanoate oxidase (formaldehyde-forming)
VGRRHPPLRAAARESPALADRTVESLGLHYAMRWPREELVTVRPLRRSPLYDRLRANGAVFGTKLNWERANYSSPSGATVPPPRSARRLAACVLRRAACVPRGRRRVRPDVVRQIRAEGPRRARGARATVRERIDVEPGRMVYTAMLNERGGFESD